MIALAKIGMIQRPRFLALACIPALTLAIGELGGARAETVPMPSTEKYLNAVLPSAPMEASSGITAIAGEVVDMNGVGLAGVKVAEGASSFITGADGKFLVSYAIVGKGVLQIDGRHVGPQRLDYGLYQVTVRALPGKTTVLPFKNWLPLIDHSHDVVVPSPTTGPVVIANPALPGLELHIPAGVVVRDADGAVVTKLGITAMPADKLPVPLLSHFDQGPQFTIQPGAACLYDSKGGIGTAQVVLPNSAHLLPKARATFFRYEPDVEGWSPYGMGLVSTDGSQIVPDAATVLTDFASAECDPKTKSRPNPSTRIPVLQSGRTN